MKLLFNLFLLYKSLPVVAHYFGLIEAPQEVQMGADGWPVTVAEHVPTDSEALLAAAGSLYAIKELLV